MRFGVLMKKVLLLGVLVLVVAGTTAPASADAKLVATVPASGAALDAVPTEVSFTFDAELSAPAYVVVTAPDGSALATGDATIDGATVTQAVGPSDQHGVFVAAYRVVSSDGHQMTGQINFSVGEVAAQTSVPSTGSGEGSGTSTDSAAAATGTGGWSWPGVRFWVGFGLFAGAAALWLASLRGRTATSDPSGTSDPRSLTAGSAQRST